MDLIFKFSILYAVSSFLSFSIVLEYVDFQRESFYYCFLFIDFVSLVQCVALI